MEEGVVALHQTEEEEVVVVEFLQQQVEGEAEVEVEVVEFLRQQVEGEEQNHKHLNLGQERDYFLEYTEGEVAVVVVER